MVKNNNTTIEELLKDVEVFSGNADVKSVLKRFIENDMLDATGLIIIWPHGEHVGIDGTPFSEPEGIWAFEKAKHEFLHGGIKFK